MSRKIQKILLGCSVLLGTLGAPLTSFANVPAHAIRMYHQEPFVEEQKKFFPFDTIYTVVDFSDMQPGEYTVTVEWVQPNGKLARNSSHVFVLQEPADLYRVHFWLKLHAEGPLAQMLSGYEFTPVVYGHWQVRINCNGKPLSTAKFEVSENIR